MQRSSAIIGAYSAETYRTLPPRTLKRAPVVAHRAGRRSSYWYDIFVLMRFITGGEMHQRQSCEIEETYIIRIVFTLKSCSFLIETPAAQRRIVRRRPSLLQELLYGKPSGHAALDSLG